MAEYLIQDTTLTNLGDSVRGINETTDTMTPAEMKDVIDNAVTEINGQTNLITQCLSALEGKAGSGGGAVETCTVSHAEVIGPGVTLYYVDGNFQLNTTSSFPIEVLKGSIIYSNISGDCSGDCTSITNSIFYVYGDCNVTLG